MKRIVTFLSLVFVSLILSSCILFSTPFTPIISIDETTTQRFSVIAYGEIEWFVDDTFTGVTGSVFEYTPPTGSTGESHIIEVRTSLSGKHCQKQWTVNIFHCDTNIQDTGTIMIENINDINEIEGYTTITGDLIITQNPDLTDENLRITQLDSLQCLHHIDGDLIIMENPYLTNTEGLRYLTDVGGDVIVRSNGITSLNLNSLASVGGELIIEANATLSNLGGLVSLNSVGSHITLSSNGIMANFGTGESVGFSRLASVNGSLIIEDNLALQNLDGLIYLTSIEGDMIITNNASLSRMAFYYLNYIGGKLSIVSNMMDAGLSFTMDLNFESLTSVGGDLDIYNNTAVLSGPSQITMTIAFPGLASIPGNLTISSNAGLTSVGNIEPSSNNGFPGLMDISGNLELEHNNRLSLLLLQSLESIGNNFTVYENINLPTCFADLIADQATITGIASINGNSDDPTACDDLTGEGTE